VSLPRGDILIVDDRPENLLALETVLGDLDQNIVRATSGQKALQILLEQEFAVILLDVRMPDMDGFETAEFVRKSKRSRITPIIFVTAREADPEQTARAYALGAVDFIQKPIQPDALRAKVKVFTDLYLQRKEVVRHTDALFRAHEELRAAYKKLENFSHTVVHNLRAPLRSMSGFCHLLRQDYSGKLLDETGQDYAARIEASAGHMDILMTDLLTYCRVASSMVKVEQLDPSPLFKEVFHPYLLSNGATRRIDVQLSEGIPQVMGHSGLLRQVLSNLVSNAVKFTAPNVRPQVRIAHETHDGWVRISIEDNGIGIPAEYHVRIFGTFEQLHERSRYPGTGMGLAVVKEAVERMGGRFGVVSELGQGSSFWIELPAGKSGVPEASKAAGITSRSSLNSGP
jgi:two-component system, sensor histidine kinase and response regulator